MKQNINTLIILAVLSLLLLTACHQLTVSRKHATQIQYHQAVEHRPAVNRMDEMERAMMQEFEMTRDPRLNAVPRERLLTAKAVQEEKFTRQAASRAVAGLQWQERGPRNVGGRTRAAIFDRNDPSNQKVWAGGAGGGLWYTNNITATTVTWNKIDDFWENLAITSIAQHPQNHDTMYVGTGEGWFNIDAIRGLGLWRTTNGGATWSKLTSTTPTATNIAFHYTQKIAVAPNGNIFVCTRDSGLMRSTNHGASFSRVLGNGLFTATTNRAADVEIAADGRIYCSLGIFSADGIYRSADNGNTWTKIYTSVANEEFRIELACAPSNANRVYALVHDGNGPDNILNNGDDGNIKKIMFTTNASGAATWTNATLPNWCDQGGTSTDFTRQQAWYNLIATVHPTNETTVYIGGIDILRTTDAGTTWTQLSQWAAGCATLPSVHADIHSIMFAPGTTNTLLIGDDGGIHYTNDAGVTFSAKNNNSYNVTQFYGVAIHPTTTNYFLGGAQDNGSHQFDQPGIDSTRMVRGGDGGIPHIDQFASDTQLTAYTGNQYGRSTNNGLTWSNAIFPVGGEFINPSDYDNTGKIFYAGFRNSAGTGGSYFRWINPGSSTSAATVPIAAFGTARVTHVQVAPNVANRVYFGLNDGRIVRVDNANGGSPTSKTLRPAGGGPVSSIAVDATSATEDHLLATYSNYGVTSVFETTNANLAAVPTWLSVEGDLPDMPIRWVIFDPRNNDWAILATELGIWTTDDLNSGGVTDWEPTNNNLANVRIDMLQYRASDRIIAAATHGRGLYTAYLPADLYTKDQLTDVGIEPNPDPGPVYWNSPDIWVRLANDFIPIHENPEAGQVNFVYVKVRNRSNTASLGGPNDSLKAYWAKAGAPLGWPNPWNGGLTACIPPAPLGGIIGTQHIGVIPPGDSITFVFPWIPPPPSAYPCFFADSSHFCLLSRIVTQVPYPHGMTFPEVNNIGLNVRNNNNIAWKNVTVYNLFPGIIPDFPIRKSILLSNPRELRLRTNRFRLTFAPPREEMEAGDIIHKHAEIDIDLGRLLPRWREAGQGGQGIVLIKDPVDGREYIRLKTPDAYIDNVVIDPDEVSDIAVRMTVYNPAATPASYNLEMVMAPADDTKNWLGGENFELRFDNRKKENWEARTNGNRTVQAAHPRIVTYVKGGTLYLSARDQNSYPCELLSENGRVLYAGRLKTQLQVDVSGLATGIYFVRFTGNNNQQWVQKVLVQRN